MDYDLVVVGSGVAGGMTALTAAQHGLRVAILEKETLPRYKTCGGGLTYQAMQLLPPLPQRVLEYEGREVDICFMEQHWNFRVQREVPIVSMAMRASLDYFVVRQAVAAGAELHAETLLKNIRREGQQLHFETSKGELVAPFVIAADGANSRVAKCLGWKKETRVLARALEYEVYTTAAEHKRLSERTRIDFEGVPSGYAWVFPKRDHLSIGLGTFSPGRRDKKVNLHKLTEDYMAWLGMKNTHHVERHAAQIPISPRKDSLTQAGVFLVGDAAGLADPITAEGISNALRSGKWAVESILEAERNPQRAETLYLQKLNAHLLPNLSAGRRLAWLFYRKPTWRNWLFERNGQRLAENFTDLLLGRRSYPDANSVLRNVGQRFLTRAI